MPTIRLRISAALLVTAIALGCGGSEGSTGPASLSSIVLTGAPTAPMLIGGTAQLVATPLNPSGSVVSNATLTWKSDNTVAATVSAGGLVTGVGLGSATITASGGGAQATVTVSVRAGVSVDVSGATLNLLNGAFTLVVPQSALVAATTVLVAPGVGLPSNARLLAETAFEVGPSTLFCNFACTLTLRYDPSKLPSGVTEASLQLYSISGGVWRVVVGSTVNTGSKTVSASIRSAGTYAIVGTAVDHITLTGAAGSALFAGQAARVQANVFDQANNALTRAVTWTSSDVSKATVNAGGDVTAIAVGSVTIEATAEGTKASTTLTILPRPVADWSGVTEWATFQGNNAHTGYVPVVADAAAFAEAWTGTIGSGSSPGAVEGAGRVFASYTGRFSPGGITAFDAATGAVAWTQPLGSNNVTMAPAYMTGAVVVQTNDIASYVWSFNDATGASRFRVGYSSQWSRYLNPVIVGQTIYHGCGTYDGLCARSAVDGSSLWFASTNQYEGWTPAVVAGVAYVYTGDYSPKLTAIDVSNGKTIYDIVDPRFSWDGWTMNSAPVVDGGRLFATQAGRLVAFDLNTRALAWDKTSAGFTGAVTTASGILYVSTGSQVDARSASDGSLSWTWILPEGSIAAPMIVTKNLLFVSTAANTYAVDLATHRQVWSYPAGGQLTLGRSGRLYISQTSGKIAAIKLK